jgi:hypothetical protein
MRKLLLFVLVMVGAAAGVAVGYAVATMEAAFSTSFVDPRQSKKEGLDRVVEDFAKLGGYESVAANCNGTSDTQPALNKEAEAIRDLQQREGSDTALLSVAEAKLLVRTLIVAEKPPSASHQASDATRQRVEDLLKNAGWTNSSEAHIRDVVRELDQDQCRQVVLGGGR